MKRFLVIRTSMHAMMGFFNHGTFRRNAEVLPYAEPHVTNPGIAPRACRCHSNSGRLHDINTPTKKPAHNGIPLHELRSPTFHPSTFQSLFELNWDWKE